MFSKNKSIKTLPFKILHDVGGLGADNAVNVALYDNYLTLSNIFVKQPITLNYSQITDVFYGFVTNTKEVNKSLIGRAVAGSLLFGNVGAIVGAMSANGKKKQLDTKLMFTISYTSSAGESCALMFEVMRMFESKKFSKKLQELCGITPKEPETVTTL